MLKEHLEQLLTRIEGLEGDLYEARMQAVISQTGGPEADKQVRYAQMVRRIRETVRQRVPRGAVVVVVGKGDQELLKLHGRRGIHFPHDGNGSYAGFYPSSSLSAIAQLETLRAQGAGYLLFPASSLWWREKYAEFYRHIERHYSAVFFDEETCAIFGLRQPAAWLPLGEAIGLCRDRLDREPAILDWDTGLGLERIFSDCNIFSPPQKAATLPYLDHTIDIVAVNGCGQAGRQEARRVASAAVIQCRSSRGGALEFDIHWQSHSETTALPTASIILLSSGAGDPARCDSRLGSFLETLRGRFQGEIIVLDKAGKSKTTKRPRSVTPGDLQVKWIDCQSNAGFRSGAMRAAKAAKGEILIFFDDAALPLPGWLTPLLQVFSSRPGAGAAGGRLLRPEGRLEQAGGVIRSDGSVISIGQGDFNPDAARYGFLREVDFCSGTMIATRRSVFHECGGFSSADQNGGRYDIAYCSRIRSKGWRVYYQPECAVLCRSETPCFLPEPNSAR